MPLRSLQLVVQEICGPSLGVPNSLVTLRAGDGALKLQLASQQWQQNRRQTLDVAVATKGAQEFTNMKTTQSRHGLQYTLTSPADWCGMALGSLQLIVEEVYGPSPSVSNSLVTLRVRDGVLKLGLASQPRRQNEVHSFDVVVAIRGSQELTEMKTLQF